MGKSECSCLSSSERMGEYRHGTRQAPNCVSHFHVDATDDGGNHLSAHGTRQNGHYAGNASRNGPWAANGCSERNVHLGSSSSRSAEECSRGTFVYRSSCELPTKHGIFHTRVYVCSYTGKEATLMMAPHTPIAEAIKDGKYLDSLKDRPLLLRVQDACFTSEIFGSLKCDCSQQLERSMKLIQEAPEGGAILYLLQEGRGIGLAAKVAAYDLQEREHKDTVDANRALGLPDDSREYAATRDIMLDLVERTVPAGTPLSTLPLRLLTNNPRKMTELQSFGLHIEKRIPLRLQPVSDLAASYIHTKASRMGHFIDDSEETESERIE
eukprot:gb/GECG01016078.1/.p1 GENE.gb/GECG01016078.1/~~gb/GECG01016078.1/.p1  ORF type:complete len:325 (+),score=26.21 gb/GECG01016078.1/:1-975(+)